MKVQTNNEYSVSVIVPCRNEAGNIESAVKRIPTLGAGTEIIFGDDKSTDGTGEKVLEMIEKYPGKKIKLVKGPGICKAENVWSCFEQATGEILMILDADLTVIPEELPYFYEAIAKSYGEFINGSRLVYTMYKGAMEPFNVIGNKFFSVLFSYILDTKIKDTLCGTKVLWRKDYEKIKSLRDFWGIRDRWGDYELIFGAAKHHLKIIDLPVHYMERTYGETKMTNRVRNGLIMLKMCFVSLRKIKFY
jgi:glycosyltransferase involved in cell wall biosynthesis